MNENIGFSELADIEELESKNTPGGAGFIVD